MIKGMLKQVAPLATAVALVLVVRTVLAEPYRVPSGSMVPTLLVGDELMGSKFAYGFGEYALPVGKLPHFEGRLFDRAPERGDVVIFRLPRDPAITYVKRLIGLPGDRIQMKAGRLYINDTLVERRSIGPFTGSRIDMPAPATRYIETLPGGREHEILEINDSDSLDDTPVFTVPPRHYFMMGDNRDNSLDSRVGPERGGVGFVPEENLVARADFLLFSYNPAVSWLDPSRWPELFRFQRSLHHID